LEGSPTQPRSNLKNHKIKNMGKFYLSLIILIILSCKKSDNLPEDNRCTNLVIDNPDIQLLPDQEIDSIKYLFNKNQISYTGLQFWNFTDSRGYNNVLFRYIGAYQFVNGLKVFTGYLGFEFGENDSFIYKGGDTIPNLSLPNKPRLLNSQVRGIFINEIKNDGFYKNNFEIQDNCIEMEFGYYDLHSGSGNQTKDYTTAWKVYPKNGNYPNAYIDDMRGELIYYDNGIETFKKQSQLPQSK
jgi:hypothetical protein